MKILTKCPFRIGSYALLLSILSGLFTGCQKADLTAPVQTPAPDASTVTATPLLSAGLGDGVNLQPSYYNNGNVTFGWTLMKSYGNIKTVRIEIEPSVAISQAASWISQARSNGYAVIATYHKASVLGSDNVSDLTAAANWWATNYKTLSAAGSFTVNLMNEWGDHNLTANEYASAYNTAIPIVRKVYSGTIIIDCSGWGQETHVAAEAIEGTDGTKISDGNILPSVHVYPDAYNQALGHYLENSDLDDLGNAGKGGIIGEFGNSPSGSANWSGIVSHAKSKGWTVIGWAWNGDGGSMNMVTPPWDSDPTASSYSPGSYFSTIYNLL